MTVSRVLNNHSQVNAETRARVLRVANQLGYVPHAYAKALASGHTHMIGLVAGNIKSEYVLEVIRGVGDETIAVGYNMILITSGQNQEQELTQVSRLMGGMVDAILMILPVEADLYLPFLDRNRLPCILIDYRAENVHLPSVRLTDREGMQEATRYLIQLGHKRIGYIKGLSDMGTTRERYNGFVDSMLKAGLEIREEYVCQGDYEPKSGYDFTKQMMSCSVAPTAIIASNDQMAFGVLEAARDMKIPVPEELSVVGFDDIPTSAKVFPPLTTVHSPIYEMGKTAVHMALDGIQSRLSEQEVRYLSTHLVIRSSTRLAPGLTLANSNFNSHNENSTGSVNGQNA